MSRRPTFPQDGGCVCGAVRYQLKAMPKAVYACHCKDCQRVSNTTHTISMVVSRTDAELVTGELQAFDKLADSGRTVRMMRCAKCGTLIWNQPLAAPDTLIMKAGSLDDLSWAEPVGNIWTASKAPWAAIDPNVPNYEGQAPSRDALMAAWTARWAEDGEK